MNLGGKLIRGKFIEPYLDKHEEYIGVELEYPLILIDNQVDSKQVVLQLFQYLKENHGFYDDKIGNDNCLVRVNNEIGDGISVEYCYEIIEFSMQKDLNLNKIADRFFYLFNLVQSFLIQHACFLTGMGTNLTSNSTHIHLAKVPYNIVINEYMNTYTTYKNPNYFLSNMQSIQTHLDIPVGGEKSLLDALNLFNRLDFVRGILFSNSLPNAASAPSNLLYPTETLCARDFNWSNSQFPDTGCVDEKFTTIDDLLDYMARLKVYFRKCGEHYQAFKPTTIADYFSNPSQADDVLSIYRYLKHVVLNLYTTLEIRSDCTQPLKDTFAPTAFNLGISRKIEQASELTEKFFKDNKITYTNSMLRSMAINDKKIVNDQIMKGYLQKLYDLARDALKERGLKEEKYLCCLQERIDTLSCPAKVQKQLIASEGEGQEALKEIINQCSKL